MNLKNLTQNQVDEFFMKKALVLAKKAAQIDEVPVGALIVDSSNKAISSAYNLREKINSTLAHAELLAIHRACKKLNSWRLIDCTLYVTLEPCFMCAGALVQSRIARVVFGAPDPKGGALVSLDNLGNKNSLNHHFKVTDSVLKDDCSKILKDFFKAKRKN